MAFFVPVTAGAFPFTHRSEVIVSFFAHSDPSTKPFSQPEEIRSVISQEEWQSRTVAIWNHFGRYTWSKLQRIYLIASVFISIFGPILINIGVNRAFFADLTPLRFDASTEEIVQRLAIIRRAHLINLLSVLGLLLILWTPYLIFKSIGLKRLSALLNSFNQADSAKGNMQALTWTCARTSTLQSNGIIIIQLPIALVSANQPSLFHQGAYLPDYIPKPTPYQAYPGGQPTYAPPPGAPPPNHEAEMLGMGFERVNPEQKK